MNTQIDLTLGRIERALETLRISPTGNEFELHTQIAAALRDGGLSVMHEARLAPRCRVDFLIDGVGIEVKRGKPDRSALLRQCGRYMSCEQVTALIVVLDTAVKLPDTLLGKPLRVIGLNRLWGIALP